MRVTALTFALTLTACASPAPQVRPASVARDIPPAASLTDGVWLRGDLHVHSRHSKDSSNNPVSKIISLAEKVGMDFLAITDHDNHVDGDVAHEPLGARPVHDRPAADDQVVHRILPDHMFYELENPTAPWRK